jgi:hypothetical protein
MWAALFFTVLILVHIQFKYCAQIGVAALKLTETAILVLVIRAYMESDTVWEYLGEWQTLNWDGMWDTWVTVGDKLSELLH